MVFNRTRVGLNLRAVGEDPATADAAGINTTVYKYMATVIGGGICGIGCVISAGVVFGYYYRMAMKNFGGVTGDLCGYFLQVCELVMALVVVVVDIVVKSGIIK